MISYKLNVKARRFRQNLDALRFINDIQLTVWIPIYFDTTSVRSHWRDILNDIIKWYYL